MDYVTGWGDIGRIFGVTAKAVKSWYAKEAPILLIGTRPVSKIDDLWYWLLDHREELTTEPPDARAKLKYWPQRSGGLSAAEAKKLVGDSGEVALAAAILAKP